MTKAEICKVLNIARNRSGIAAALVELGIVALVEDADGKIVPALRILVHDTEAECAAPEIAITVTEATEPNCDGGRTLFSFALNIADTNVKPGSKLALSWLLNGLPLDSIGTHALFISDAAFTTIAADGSQLTINGTWGTATTITIYVYLDNADCANDQTLSLTATAIAPLTESDTDDNSAESEYIGNAPCNAFIDALIAGEVGVTLDITSSVGNYVNVHYNYNLGETEGDIGCQELSDTFALGEVSQYFMEANPTTITVNISHSDDCSSVACSTSFTITPYTLEVELEGDDIVFTPESLPDCDGEVAFVELFVSGVSDTVLDTETGNLTIPAQTTGGGSAIYYMTCDGNVVAVISVAIANPALALRLTFDNIAKASSVSVWNTFFDLPTNGTPFTSVGVAGNEVSLYGGIGLNISAALFSGFTTLVGIYDDLGIVTAIDDNAFEDATGLVTANLPYAITVGASSFKGATGLTTLVLTRMTTAGADAFFDSGLTSISLPAATTLGTQVFGKTVPNATLTNVSLPVCVTIGQGCFGQNTGLTTVTAPVLTAVPDFAFYLCSALVTISLPAATTLGTSAFYLCTSLTTFTGANVLSTAVNTFNGCTSLTTITLTNCTTIDPSTFYNCAALVTISLPSANVLGNFAFANCTSLTTVTAASITSIGISCFDGCTSLATFNGANILTVGDNAFSGATSLVNLNLSSCTALGSTSGNDGVFAGIVGNTITVTVPIALQTNNGGNPDGDLQDLAANNTATINYI